MDFLIGYDDAVCVANNEKCELQELVLWFIFTEKF